MADTKFDLSGYVVRTPRGEIDIQQTHMQFTQDVAALVQSEKMNNDVIAQAVERTFQENKLDTLSMSAVLHYTMEKLTVNPDSFNAVRERVATYLRSNKARFQVRKGKGGGVSWLKEDVSATTSAPPPSASASAGTISIRPRDTSAAPRA